VISASLDRLPDEAVLVVASRAALRVLPLIVRERNEPEFLSKITFNSFRSAMISWVISRYPEYYNSISESANAAARAITPINTNLFAAFSDYGAIHASSPRYDRTGNIIIAISNASTAFLLIPESYDVDAQKNLADAATAADFAFLRAGAEESLVTRALTLAKLKLWLTERPTSARDAWQELQDVMLSDGDDWDFWIRWYQDRLAGEQSLGETSDIAIATLPDGLWEQGPAGVINPRIKELIAEHTHPSLSRPKVPVRSSALILI
jgi:hypothetical protein